MKFKELLKKCNIDEVFCALVNDYPEEEHKFEGYREVYEKLLSKRARKSAFTIICEECVDDFDNTPFINVYGIENNDKDKPWGLCFLTWSEWLGMTVDDNRLIDDNRFVASCLYELTFHGFTERHVAYRRNKLNKIVDDVKEGNYFDINEIL